jgi:deoxyribodipyrimidine photo-lyase
MTSICLLHDEMLNPGHILLQQHVALPRAFVFDMGSNAYGRWSLKRLQFMADCLAEIPELQIYRGHLTQVLVQLKVREVYTQATPQQWLHQRLEGFTVHWVDEPVFIDNGMPLDKTPRRFMAYWKKREASALQSVDAPAPDLQAYPRPLRALHRP